MPEESKEPEFNVGQHVRFKHGHSILVIKSEYREAEFPAQRLYKCIRLADEGREVTALTYYPSELEPV